MNILAIGSHPDDIEYGCSGTLGKFIRQGHDVYIMVMTHGRFGASPEVQIPEQLQEMRINEQLQANKILNVKEIFWGEYVDTQIPMGKELIDRIEAVVWNIQPTFTFVHFPEDTHQDHRTTANATISAARFVKNILFYEGPTTQNFNPTVFVNICETLDTKIEALYAHASQATKTHRTIENLTIVESARSCATFRGIQGRVKYAEAFVPLRMFITI